jgi:addiction module HigA family antidote
MSEILNREDLAKIDWSDTSNGAASGCTSPGDVSCGDYVAPPGLSADPLAVELDMSPEAFAVILRGAGVVSPETAARLGDRFGTGAAFWINL